MVFGHVVTVGRQGVALITVVLSQGLRCANGLRKVVTNSSLLSLQATLLVVNVLIFSAGARTRWLTNACLCIVLIKMYPSWLCFQKSVLP
jgi:hypothetical protein